MFTQVKNVKFILPHYSELQPYKHKYDEPYVEILARLEGEFVKLDSTIAMLEDEYVALVGSGKLEDKIIHMIREEIRHMRV